MTSAQIEEATALKAALNQYTIDLCTARDDAAMILRNHELFDETVGAALLTRCKAEALAAGQAIIGVSS